MPSFRRHAPSSQPELSAGTEGKRACTPDAASSSGCCLAPTAQLLFYSAVICKLPFRAHLAVQTVNWASLALLARTNFCASELLSTPLASDVMSSVHAAAAAIGATLLPASAALAPHSAGGTCEATLLFVWTIVGLLVPRWASGWHVRIGFERACLLCL